MKKCYLPITQNKIRIFLRVVTHEAFLGAPELLKISLCAIVCISFGDDESSIKLSIFGSF